MRCKGSIKQCTAASTRQDSELSALIARDAAADGRSDGQGRPIPPTESKGGCAASVAVLVAFAGLVMAAAMLCGAAAGLAAWSFKIFSGG